MVQRKVANKLGIQANHNLKTEKRQANTKPSLQNHDVKSKGGDLRAIRMKKSRSIKRSEIDISLRSTPKTKSHEVVRQPGEPPPMLTPPRTPSMNPVIAGYGPPLLTPSPKKPSPCKLAYASPNYMKSTSSSEAKKEKTTKVSSMSSTSKLHRVAKTLSKTSSLKKVRTLTKAPSFKHTRTGTNNKKVIYCERNLDVQKGTCSSTLKDSKFPPYLTLNPGATEAEGTSVLRVCPYNYCSLNGHHHSPAPPLKRFLSSRRRVLKTQKVVEPKVVFPQKTKPSKNKVNGDDFEVDQNKDFFVKIYVPGREFAATNDDMTMEHDSVKVSVSLSDGPCSEIDFQDDVYQGISNSEDEDYPLRSVQNQTLPKLSENDSDLELDTSPSVNLDEFFYESSDMEWEEGQIPTAHDKRGEISVEHDIQYDQNEPGFESENSFSGCSEEFLADEFPPYFHEEIMEFGNFSDSDLVSDTEYTQTGEEHIKELVMVVEENNINSEPEDQITETDSTGAAICTAKLEDESIDEQGEISSKLIDEFTEIRNKDPTGTSGNDSNGDDYTVIREENNTDNFMEEIQPKAEGSENFSAKEEIPEAVDKSEPGNEANTILSTANDENFSSSPYKNVADSGFEEHKENEGYNCTSTSSRSSEEENDSSGIKLHSGENRAMVVKAPEMEDNDKTEEADAAPAITNKSQEAKKCIYHGGTDYDQKELIDGCKKLKRSTRCKIADEYDEEGREFNPRGPNFLPIEPDPDAEKVDLRHQEMDERRNAEEWMLDYALRKTVNQLAPARKRKVALLVEAFEAVLPIPKCEPHTRRRNSAGFPHVRHIQACN